MTILSVKNLCVRFHTNDGEVFAVNDVSFDVQPGQKLALVGESGSGKSQIAFAILGLLAQNGRSFGEVNWGGKNLLNLPLSRLNKIRAREISIIFQDPMTSLNPYMRISDQMSEVLMLHEGLSRSASLARALDMMEAVRIPDAKNRINAYPHEFSGGMRQRIVIAMALLCRPGLIIADEPTTALDVTVQAQIMQLLDEIQGDFGSTILLITHDLGVVAGFCDEVLVLYGGRLMERAQVKDLFKAPSHPYTRGLLRSIPNLAGRKELLDSIPGSPPNLHFEPVNCPFAPRCPDRIDACLSQLPALSPSAPIRACLRPVEELSA